MADPDGGLTSDERQYLVWKKATAVPDKDLNYGLMVQAADFAAATPNALVFAVGNGSAINRKASTLQITDNDWHFVSAAFDPASDTVRFVLDDQVETFTDFAATMASNIAAEDIQVWMEPDYE